MKLFKGFVFSCYHFPSTSLKYVLGKGLIVNSLSFYFTCKITSQWKPNPKRVGFTFCKDSWVRKDVGIW